MLQKIHADSARGDAMADTQVLEQRKRPTECISIEQFLEWQEEDIHAEWVAGKVLIMSPTSLRHQELV